MSKLRRQRKMQDREWQSRASHVEVDSDRQYRLTTSGQLLPAEIDSWRAELQLQIEKAVQQGNFHGILQFSHAKDGLASDLRIWAHHEPQIPSHDQVIAFCERLLLFHHSSVNRQQLDHWSRFNLTLHKELDMALYSNDGRRPQRTR
jgi:hypothetical protein